MVRLDQACLLMQQQQQQQQQQQAMRMAANSPWQLLCGRAGASTRRQRQADAHQRQACLAVLLHIDGQPGLTGWQLGLEWSTSRRCSGRGGAGAGGAGAGPRPAPSRGAGPCPASRLRLPPRHPHHSALPNFAVRHARSVCASKVYPRSAECVCLLPSTHRYAFVAGGSSHSAAPMRVWLMSSAGWGPAVT